MKPDPATPNHAASMAAAINRAARRYDGLLPDLEPILERTIPSLRAVVLTGAAELLASALDLVRLEPTMHHRNAAEALADAVCELVASVTRRRCRQCGCTDSDCARCIETTGEPCTWAEPDLCSACAEPPQADTPPPPHPSETVYVGRLGPATPEQRDLLQSCLLQAGPAMHRVLREMSHPHGVSYYQLEELREVLRGSLTHPGWRAAGLSFAPVYEPLPRLDARTQEPARS